MFTPPFPPSRTPSFSLLLLLSPKPAQASSTAITKDKNPQEPLRKKSNHIDQSSNKQRQQKDKMHKLKNTLISLQLGIQFIKPPSLQMGVDFLSYPTHSHTLTLTPHAALRAPFDARTRVPADGFTADFPLRE